MNALTLARVIVAVGGLFFGFVLLVVGLVDNAFVHGGAQWIFNLGCAIFLGYCILVVRAVRGHRLAAGIVAALAWCYTLASWLALEVIVIGGHSDLFSEAVAFALATTVYAFAATYIARGRGSPQSGASPRPNPE